MSGPRSKKYGFSPRIIVRFNVPNVIQRRDYFNTIQTYKCLHEQSDNYMSDMLSYVNDFNNYTTRNLT